MITKATRKHESTKLAGDIELLVNTGPNPFNFVLSCFRVAFVPIDAESTTQSRAVL
jgi:hypothetical protein